MMLEGRLRRAGLLRRPIGSDLMIAFLFCFERGSRDGCRRRSHAAHASGLAVLL
jgi:hypothetical protein